MNKIEESLRNFVVKAIVHKEKEEDIGRLVEETYEIAKKGYKRSSEEWKKDTEGLNTILYRHRNNEEIENNELFREWVENLFNRARGAKKLNNDVIERLKKMTQDFDPHHTKDLSEYEILYAIEGDRSKVENKKNNDNRGHLGIAKAIKKSARIFNSRRSEILKDINKIDNDRYDVYRRWIYVTCDRSGLMGMPTVGTAIFCSFLLRIGARYFVKPDTVLKKLFCGAEGYENNFSIFYTIDYISRIADMYPRTVDKIFWLVAAKSAVEEEYVDEETQEEWKMEMKNFLEERGLYKENGESTLKR